MICKKASLKWIVLVCLIFILLAAVCASVVYGYTGTSWRQVYQAFTSFNGTNEHVIIKDVRLPRALVATVVGASLAAAGALMQALTKNPLASPGIFCERRCRFFYCCRIVFSAYSVTSGISMELVSGGSIYRCDRLCSRLAWKRRADANQTDAGGSCHGSHVFFSDTRLAFCQRTRACPGAFLADWLCAGPESGSVDDDVSICSGSAGNLLLSRPKN